MTQAATQAVKISFSGSLAIVPAAPMATIRVRGARLPHSCCIEISTRRPTT